VAQTHLIPDVLKLKESLGTLPEPVVRPALIAVSGLPGTGKTHFCQKLSEKLPYQSIILESDALRKTLFPHPTYAPAESARLFQAIHLLTEDLLQKNIPVILDATNLSEPHRERLYHIADRAKAKLILVWVEAPPEVVRQRLLQRAQGITRSHSDADWTVFQKMQPTVDRIRRNHFVVDTSRDITPVIDKIIRALKK
jgi:predicted kinase